MNPALDDSIVFTTDPPLSGALCSLIETEPVEPPTMADTETGFLKRFFEFWGIEPRPDHSHANQANWIDEPPYNGRIRTHCKICGGFVGYRPVPREKSRGHKT